MSETVAAKKVLKKKTVYNTMALVFVITSLVFIYSFFSQNVPVTAQVQSLVDPNAPPSYDRMIYGGFGADALNKPMDVTVIDQFIYVSDTNNRQVRVYDMAGTEVFKFGERGDKEGQFNFPYGIAGDSKGNVYIADLYNGTISVHDAKGKFIKYFAEKDPEEATIHAPGGLRIFDGKLYVTEIRDCTVKVFDLNGKQLFTVGSKGRGEGQMLAPNAVTVDKDGTIYAVDTGNARVQVYDKEGKFLRTINGSKDGKGASTLVNPRGIAIDSRGIIYVVSNLTHYIYGFNKEGERVFVFGGNGSTNDKFSLPNGLFVDQNDEVFITDTTNQRVAIYN